MTELETRLVQALDGLSQQLEGLEHRLQTMTRNYQILSGQMQDLTAQLAHTGTQHNDLMQRLDDMQSAQTGLEQSLSVLQAQLQGSSGKR